MYIDQSLHLQSSSKSGQGPPCCWWPSATAPPRATPPAAPAPRWASVRWANCSWSSAAKRPTVARWEVHNETMVKLWIYGILWFFMGFWVGFEWVFFMEFGDLWFGMVFWMFFWWENWWSGILGTMLGYGNGILDLINNEVLGYVNHWEVGTSVLTHV